MILSRIQLHAGSSQQLSRMESAMILPGIIPSVAGFTGYENSVGVASRALSQAWKDGIMDVFVAIRTNRENPHMEVLGRPLAFKKALRGFKKGFKKGCLKGFKGLKRALKMALNGL